MSQVSLVGVSLQSEAPRSGDGFTGYPVSCVAGTAQPHVGLFPKSDIKAALYATVTLTRADAHATERWILEAHAADELIGDVPPTTVVFPVGMLTTRVGVIAPHKLLTLPVGEWSHSWEWTLTDGGSVVDLGRTTHPIFTIPARPSIPWGVERTPDIEPPWLEVLSVACRWAAGCLNVDNATRAVAAAVYTLPPKRFTYSSGAQYYAGGFGADRHFRCDHFLDTYHGLTSPQLIGCADVAAILTTFASVLGASLLPGPMDAAPHIDWKTRPILALGHKKWESFCFTYHEVAWEPPFTPDAAVWDASFVFGTPRSPRPIIGTPFNATYRDLMMEAGKQARLRQSNERPDPRRVAYTRSKWTGPIFPVSLPGWILLRAEPGVDIPDTERLQYFWIGETDTDQRLTLDVVRLSPRANAEETFRRLAHENTTAPLYPYDLGARVRAVANSSEQPTNLSFVSNDAGGSGADEARWAARYTSVGLHPVSVEPMALSLVAQLQSL